MSLGFRAGSNPEVWEIINGKLYLFGHEEGRQRWQTETGWKIKDAEESWRDYLKEKS